MVYANKQQNHPRRSVGLVLTLVVLISAATPATGPIRPASAQENIPSWSYTGSLNFARVFHTATLLSDGRVLVVGGSSSPNTAELYDPLTGTWSATGSLNMPHSYHTATLLPDGEVLVAGGGVDDSKLGSAELYDPDTGSWSVTGSLNTPRFFHSATLLRNGKVLVAEGMIGSNSVLNTAELYDPAKGTWSSADTLSLSRYLHTATLLQDGKVLVAGGCVDGDCDVPLNIAELYDPNTGAWGVTGRANALRERHTATLLPDGQVLVAGGGRQFQNLDTNELYNPATERWSFTSNLIRHTNHTATLLPNGKVLVAGGETFEGVFKIVNGAEIYDPATGNWSSTASLNSPRFLHTATLLQNGKVLVVGGTFGSDYVRSAELYDPEMLDPAPAAPRIIMASVSGKKLFITGENFHAGAVILLNGEEQKSKNDEQNPQTTLIGKKAGKKVKAGDRIQVRNPDGSLSEEFIFTGL